MFTRLRFLFWLPLRFYPTGGYTFLPVAFCYARCVHIFYCYCRGLLPQIHALRYVLLWLHVRSAVASFAVGLYAWIVYIYDLRLRLPRIYHYGTGYPFHCIWFCPYIFPLTPRTVRIPPRTLHTRTAMLPLPATCVSTFTRFTFHRLVLGSHTTFGLHLTLLRHTYVTGYHAARTPLPAASHAFAATVLYGSTSHRVGLPHLVTPPLLLLTTPHLILHLQHVLPHTLHFTYTPHLHCYTSPPAGPTHTTTHVHFEPTLFYRLRSHLNTTPFALHLDLLRITDADLPTAAFGRCYLSGAVTRFDLPRFITQVW